MSDVVDRHDVPTPAPGRLYPREVEAGSGVFDLGYCSEDSFGASAWLIVRPAGNVLDRLPPLHRSARPTHRRPRAGSTTSPSPTATTSPTRAAGPRASVHARGSTPTIGGPPRGRRTPSPASRSCSPVSSPSRCPGTRRGRSPSCSTDTGSSAATRWPGATRTATSWPSVARAGTRGRCRRHRWPAWTQARLRRGVPGKRRRHSARRTPPRPARLVERMRSDPDGRLGRPDACSWRSNASSYAAHEWPWRTASVHTLLVPSLTRVSGPSTEPPVSHYPPRRHCGPRRSNRISASTSERLLRRRAARPSALPAAPSPAAGPAQPCVP
jgi:hypothetical protein